MGLERNVLIAVLVLALVLSGAAYAALQYHYSIHNHGTISTIGCVALYDNATLIKNIEWGTLTPNSWQDKTIQVKNNGTVNIALGLSTENWNPTNASSWITLNWNYTGQTLTPNQKIPLLLTLQTSANITGIIDFTFDTIITATQV
jgi:hypothetical protein